VKKKKLKMIGCSVICGNVPYGWVEGHVYYKEPFCGELATWHTKFCSLADFKLCWKCWYVIIRPVATYSFFFMVRGPMRAPWQAVSVKAVRCFSLCSLGVSFEANRAVCLLASNNLVLPFVSIEARSTRTAFWIALQLWFHFQYFCEFFQCTTY